MFEHPTLRDFFCASQLLVLNLYLVPCGWDVKNPGFKLKNCFPKLSFFHLRRRLPEGQNFHNRR
jgi:hypothetical protein